MKNDVRGTCDVTEDQIQSALGVARETRERAYVPYSGFRMGAAVVTSHGAIVPGALVENVSLGLAMCAERIALFATVAQDAGVPRALVLAAPRTSGEITRPCGACLQVALELGGPHLVIVLSDTQGGIERTTVGQLAPSLPFKPESFTKHLAGIVKTTIQELKA